MEMEIELGQPIAYGRTAEIYAWHEGQVLKLFYDWFKLDDIQTEASNTRAIHAGGLPVPGVGEIVHIQGRYGLEYQRLDGKSMFKMIRRKPWKAISYARRWAQLQAGLHSADIPADLPSQRQVLEKNIREASALPESMKFRILSNLAGMPESDRVCHGDFWPANIQMTSQGERVIDWFRASRGNRLADLARTTNLLFGFTRTRQSKRQFLSFGSSRLDQVKNALFRAFSRFGYPIFLNEYFRLLPGDHDEYQRWLPIVAAARLSDNIPELEKMLLAQVEQGI